jgi:hypothetical protein
MPKENAGTTDRRVTTVAAKGSCIMTRPHGVEKEGALLARADRQTG